MFKKKVIRIIENKGAVFWFVFILRYLVITLSVQAPDGRNRKCLINNLYRIKKTYHSTEWYGHAISNSIYLGENFY